MKIADVLDKAADLIEPEGRWCRDPFALDSAGTELLYGGHPDAQCWCALGAIEHVTGRVDQCGEDMEAAYTTVADFVGEFELMRINFDAGQLGAVSRLREAAAEAREQGL
jgi:hypothetical protein